MEKPEFISEIEELTGLEFVYIPQGHYKIGTEETAKPIANFQGSIYPQTTKLQSIETSGFWISRTVFRKSNLEKIAKNNYKIQAEIPLEEWESYTSNLIADIRYGVQYGWKKVPKDFIENDPPITLSKEGADALARELGLAIPDYTDWEIAMRGKNADLYPGGDFLLNKKFQIEEMKYAYRWEDPESTMGYRETKDVEGFKFRLQNWQDFSEIESYFGLRDCVFPGGEWNKSLDLEKKWMYRSISDPRLSKTVYNLSDNEEENKLLRASDHRSFSGMPLYCFSGTDSIRVAAFRFVIHAEKENISEKTDSIPQEADWKLYSLLGENIRKALEYLGEPDYIEKLDSSSGWTVYLTQNFHYYRLGIVVEGLTQFVKVLRITPSAGLCRIQKIRLMNNIKASLQERHSYKGYKNYICDTIQLKDLQFSENQELANSLFQKKGLKFSIRASNEGLDIEIADANLFLELQKETGVYKPFVVEAQNEWTTEEHTWEIRGLHFWEEDWISLGLDGKIKFWNYSSGRSQKTLNRTPYSPGFNATWDLGNKKILIGNKEGELEIWDLATAKIETLHKCKIKYEIIEKFVAQLETIILFTTSKNKLYAFDLEKKEILYSVSGQYASDDPVFAFHAIEKKIINGISGKICKVEDGEKIGKLPEGVAEYDVKEILFNSDCSYLFLITPKKIKVYDWNKNAILQEMEIPGRYGLRENTIAIWIEKYKVLVVGTFGKLLFYDPANNQFLQEIDYLEIISTSLSYNPIHDLLYVGVSTGKIFTWEIPSAKCQRKYGGQKGLIYSVGYSPETKILATGDSEGTIFFYDCEEKELKYTTNPHTSSVTHVEFIEPDKILSASWDGYVIISNFQGKILWKSKNQKDWIFYAKYLEDEKIFLAMQKGKILVLDKMTNRAIFELQLVWKKNQYLKLEAIAYSLERKEFSYYLEDYLYVHDLYTGEEKKSVSIEKYFTSSAYSPDGKYIFYGESSGKIHCFDSESLELVRILDKHIEGVSKYIFFGDWMISTGKEEALCIWNWVTGESIGSQKNSSGGVCPAVFIDKNHFATGGSDGKITFKKIIEV